MRVSRIYVKDILGIEEMDIRPGVITQVTGKNGTGKSSIIQAVLSVVKGGHDATLLRKGAESGESVIYLDGGNETYRRRVTPERTTLQRSDANNKKLPEAKGHLEDLIDSLSVNPIAFLTASGKEKAQKLLEVLPLKVEAEDLKEVGIDPVAEGINNSLFEKHGLEVLRGVYDHLFDTRQAINRDAKQKRSTETQLREALPEEREGISEQLSVTRQRLAEIDAGLQTKKNEIARLLESRKAEIAKDYAQQQAAAQKTAHDGIRQCDAIIADLEAKLAAARRGRQDVEQTFKTTTASLTDRESIAIAEARAEANAAFNHYQSKEKDTRSSVVAEIATLEAEFANQVRVTQSRELMEQMRAEAEEKELESRRLTGLLELLENFRHKKLLDLPIKGLEVKDGEIHLDGIHIDRLNWSKQVALALRVAKLRAKECPLVCVDNLECLDSETYAKFEEAAMKSGLQFIVTRVSDGPLTITTRGDVS